MNFLRKIVKNEFLLSVVLLFTSSVFAHIISFIFSFILARIYGPDDWSDFTLFSSLSFLLGIMVTGKYEFALFLPRNEKRRNEVLILCLGLPVIVTAFLYIPFTALYFLDLNPFNSYKIEVIFYLPLVACLMGMQNAFFAWYNSTEQYKRMFYPRLLRSSLVHSSQSVLGWAGQGANGLWQGFVGGHFITSIFFYVTNINVLVDNFKNPRLLVHLFGLARLYKKYPRFFILSELLNFLASQLPVFFLAFFFESTVLGEYGFAHRFVILPAVLVAGSVNKAFLQKSSQQSFESAGLVAFQIFKKMILLSVVPFAFLFFWAEDVFVLFFGERWAGGGEIISIIVPWLLVMFVAVPISSIFPAHEKQKEAMFANMVLFSSRFISLFIGAYYFQSVTVTFILYTIVGVVYWLSLCLYIFKKTGISLYKPLLFISFVCFTVFAFFGIIHFLIEADVFY